MKLSDRQPDLLLPCQYRRDPASGHISGSRHTHLILTSACPEEGEVHFPEIFISRQMSHVSASRHDMMAVSFALWLAATTLSFCPRLQLAPIN